MPIHLEPLVVPTDHSAPITIRGLLPDTRYTVHVRALRQHGAGVKSEWTTDRNGHLNLCGVYATRGEYSVRLEPATASPGGEPLSRLSFYALPPDLYARRPLRCDFHIHTHYSDGNSPPARMVIRARELGLDVAVITDHNRYPPSLQAMAAGVERPGGDDLRDDGAVEQADLLVVSNPGGFVEGVTLDNLLVVEPRPRNPQLADAFKRIGLAERGEALQAACTDRSRLAKGIGLPAEQESQGGRVDAHRHGVDVPGADDLQQAYPGIAQRVRGAIG